MQTPNQVRCRILLPLAVAGIAMWGYAEAQTTKETFLEEVIVTATKRAGGINVQEAPVAISAYSDSQLDAMYIRDLKAIGFAAPSVQLEDIGTARGVANFSIRGLGINSSIPSIDPTVGVFVDGMYLGINGGVVLDIFDLEGIEVLRGPQGILFGRNVTGGAVLLRTTRPSDELSVNARVAYETGDNYYASAVLSGPFSDSIGGKLAVYYNDDGGWFTNLYDNSSFGDASTKIYRGALDFTPNDDVDVIVRFEHGDSDGDGPAAQNAGLFSPDGFNFSIDEPGYYDTNWDQAIAEMTWDVGPGDGQIVDILGWRDYDSATLGDIDASPFFVFHAYSTTKQNQISNELRYTGTFGDAYLTSGLYYFSQSIHYRENRVIPSVPLDITGGGDQDQDTVALFANVDYRVTDDITFNLGARYTHETKDGKIAPLLFNQCDLGGDCASYSFQEKRTWNSFTPKVGIQIQPDEYTMMYAFWAQGVRSGGFNFRHTAVAVPPASFDEENQDSFEVGLKKDIAGGRLRFNAAAYLNKIKDLQREINTSDPVVGVVQIITNTADATITGFDAEFQAALSDTLLLRANLGYVDGGYDEVRYDLNGDGVIDSADLALALPRLAPWSYGAELIYSRDTGVGTFTAQASGYRRDQAAYTDNNRGWLRASDMFDASVSMTMLQDRLKVSIFGRNLKGESTIGGDTQLPPNFPGGPAFVVPTYQGSGATFSPLNKGRIYGIELQYRM